MNMFNMNVIKRSFGLVVAVCGLVGVMASSAVAIPSQNICRTIRPLNRDQYKFATPQRSVYGDNTSPITYFKFNPTLINVTNQTRYTAGFAKVYDTTGRFLFSARKLYCDRTPGRAKGVCYDRYKYEGSTTTQQFINGILRRTGGRRAAVMFYWQVNPRTKACVATRANVCANVNMGRYPCNRVV